MSPTTSARCVPRTTALRVVEHLVHRDAHRRLVAEHHLPERVADEDHRDARLVDDARGRVVVRGEHRDALAVGVHPGDVGDGQASYGFRSWRSCWLRAVVALASRAAPSRPSSARTPGRAARRRPGAWTSAATSSGSPPADDDRHAIGVGPEAGARLGDVVGDEQVDALARAFSAARSSEPVSAAKPTTTGRWSRGRARAARDGLGQDVAGRLELERQPARCARAWCRRRARPEVGHGGGHDEHVRAVGASPPRASRPRGRPRSTRSTHVPGRSAARRDIRGSASLARRAPAPRRRSRRPSCPWSDCR